MRARYLDPIHTTLGLTLAAAMLGPLIAPAPAHAQEPDLGETACELLDPRMLTTGLPEEFLDYQYDQTSVAPPVGDGPRESVTVNILYANPEDEGVFITVSHFCPGVRDAEAGAQWDARVQRGDAMETQYRGHTAYMQQDPAAGAIHVGSDIEIGAHGAGPETPWGAIEEAIEMVDMAELEEIATPRDPGAAADRPAPRRTPPPARPAAPPADVDRDTDRECTTNTEARQQALEMIGAGNAELWPWVHVISAEQAEDVEVTDARVSDGRVAFPRDGHPWLECVQKNDVLWSPLAANPTHQFVRRVLEITEEDDQYVFHTEGAGLTDIFRRANVRMESGGAGNDSTPGM